MAIGTLGAIGLGLAGAGLFASSSAANRNSRRAVEATTQASDQAAAVTRETYGQSAAALAPWQQQGLAANRQMNAMLGIEVPEETQMGGQMGGQMGANALSYFGQPGVFDDYGAMGGNFPIYGDFNPMMSAGFGQPTEQPTAQPTSQPAANPWDGFKKYLSGSDYAFQFGEGANRVNSGYAGAGAVKSGAATKSLERFRQDLQAGYRGEYMGQVANQQGIGFGAASAQAGVSQQTGNALAGIYQNQGQNVANAQLNRQSPLGNVASMIGGGIFGRYG